MSELVRPGAENWKLVMDKDEGGSGILLGPWSVAMLERPQLYPYYVVRQIGMSHWEQMLADFGAAARFESYSEAEVAADAANANEPNVALEPPYSVDS